MQVQNVKLKQRIISSIRAFLCSQDFIEVYPTRIGKHALVNSGMDINGLFDFQYYDQCYYLSQTSQSMLEIYASKLKKCFSITPCYYKEKNMNPQNLSEFWAVEAEWSGGALEEIIDTSKEMLNFIYTDLIKDFSEDGWNLDWLNDSFCKEKYVKGITVKKPCFITNYPIDESDWISCRFNEDLDLCQDVALVFPLKNELQLQVLSGGVRCGNIEEIKCRFQKALEHRAKSKTETDSQSIDAEFKEAYNIYMHFKNKLSEVTCGFGMGIERLMMCIANVNDMSEVCDFEDSEMIRQYRS